MATALGSYSSRDWARLARRVTSRRAELGMKQQDAAKRAPMAPNSWWRVEDGQRLQEQTLYKIDHALSWGKGTALAILNNEAQTSKGATDVVSSAMNADEVVWSYSEGQGTVAYVPVSLGDNMLPQRDVERIVRVLSRAGTVLAEELTDE